MFTMIFSFSLHLLFVNYSCIVFKVEPAATRDTVKKKINSIRSSYRKEKKKVDASTRSGAATEDIYEPSLWYFHLLEFLNDQETPRQSTSNFDDTQVRCLTLL